MVADIQRSVYKAIGATLSLMICILMLASGRSLSASKMTRLAGILPVYLALALSEALNANFIYATSAFLRFVVVTQMLLILTLLSDEELSLLRKIFVRYITFIAAISIVILFSGLQTGEKFPGTNIYSNRSIIFEQNVFGIAMLFLVAEFVFRPGGWLKFGLANVGLALSFYRTVYPIALVLLFFRQKFIWLGVMLIGSGYIYSNWEMFSSTLKLSQISTLTGRTNLWGLGLIGFQEKPILGWGESSIPDYLSQYFFRDPQYTTFHNVLVDVLFSAGTVGLFLYAMLIATFVFMIGVRNIIYSALLLLPSIMNTYYPFSPNIIGAFLAIIAYSESSRLR